MRFSRIEISNYRQYKEIEFGFDKTSNNDIHLIIASNGVGKTNLLNAINWCLYGDEPHTSGTLNRVTEADRLSLCNLDALAKAKDEDENVCVVSVSIKMIDNFKEYTFTRSVSISVSTYLQVGRDKFIIEEIIGGDTKYYEGEVADEIVGRYLPKKIREYFYFDGEQLLNYFDPDSSKISHIKDSIYEIAQVNIISEVEKHLNDFVKKYQKLLSRLSPKIEEKTKKLDEIIEKINQRENEINQLKEQIILSEKNIQEMDKIINGTEKTVEDNNLYNKNKIAISEYEEKLNKTKIDLKLFVRKYSLLLFLYDTNKRTEDYILSRASDGSLVPDINIETIKESLEEHKCRICGNELNDSAEDYLQSLVDKFMSNASIQKLTEIKNDVQRGLRISTYKEDKKRIFDLINEYEEKIKTLISENDKLYTRISTVSEISEIETAMSQKKKNENLIKLNSEKIGSYETKCEELIRIEKEVRREYNQAVADNEECDELKKRLDFVMDAKGIISNVKEEIVNDVKNKLEKRTMEIFEELLWKKETYGGIELDDTFRLKLYHKNTGSSCLHSCSAAEKELLALAFTIAIHEVSGYDNLLFIDTPVGRVSDYNRENFAKVLLEVSQDKQIILAFTPSEFSSEISAVLNKLVISSSNRLSTDEVSTSMEV